MALPFFYSTEYYTDQKEIVLDEETSKHIVQVLRMKKGEQLNLTDGKGTLLLCEITEDHKKHCNVRVLTTSYQQQGTRNKEQGTSNKEQGTSNKEQGTRNIAIGISLLKNANRFEWFLEKATEIGITEIIPLICERTEKEKFRHDRMQGICISAMLQSQQCWLPLLHEPIAYELLFRQEEVAKRDQKFIAHCIDDAKRSLADLVNENLSSQLILIGPEGDFTKEEVASAIHHHFIPVTLGETRLRSETAGVVAAALLVVR